MPTGLQIRQLYSTNHDFGKKSHLPFLIRKAKQVSFDWKDSLEALLNNFEILKDNGELRIKSKQMEYKTHFVLEVAGSKPSSKDEIVRLWVRLMKG